MRDAEFHWIRPDGRAGYGLTTASILYYMPDHPGLLQSFVWQFYDICPDYPRLGRFLDYWRREIVAAIHSVEVAHNRLVTPAEVRSAAFYGRLN
ncbi:hypothetical protein ACUN0C_13310 [Faunimonas sp. B44]|uniref:hypothetical protein n=1 Tax=Faunimonas sp. B44 TaxID=3461493 RepID=UPI004044CE35